MLNYPVLAIASHPSLNIFLFSFLLVHFKPDFQAIEGHIDLSSNNVFKCLWLEFYFSTTEQSRQKQVSLSQEYRLLSIKYWSNIQHQSWTGDITRQCSSLSCILMSNEPTCIVAEFPDSTKVDETAFKLRESAGKFRGGQTGKRVSTSTDSVDWSSSRARETRTGPKLRHKLHDEMAYQV